MSTQKLSREQFDHAVAQHGLTEHEPMIGENRRHFSNSAGVWGVREGEGVSAQYLLHVPGQQPV